MGDIPNNCFSVFFAYRLILQRTVYRCSRRFPCFVWWRWAFFYSDMCIIVVKYNAM